jgi:hypothetical protein
LERGAGWVEWGEALNPYPDLNLHYKQPDQALCSVNKDIGVLGGGVRESGNGAKTAGSAPILEPPEEIGDEHA